MVVETADMALNGGAFITGLALLTDTCFVRVGQARRLSETVHPLNILMIVVTTIFIPTVSTRHFLSVDVSHMF